MKIRSWNKDLHVRFKSDDDYLLFHTTYMNRFRIINRRPRAYDRVRVRVYLM